MKNVIIAMLTILNISNLLFAGDSLLSALDKVPKREQNKDWKEERTYIDMAGSSLRKCLENLYFGDHNQALEAYCECIDYTKIQAEKVSSYYLVEHEKPLYSVIEKDGYYFIQEDDEPEGFTRVLLKENEKKLRTILIPEKEYDSFVKEMKKENIEVNKYWRIKPEKKIIDPITNLLEHDDRYFTRELVERIKETVEYR